MKFFLMKKIGVDLGIKYDKSKPDGMPKKCLDISLAKKYGYKPINSFDRGFEETFKFFKQKRQVFGFTEIWYKHFKWK